MSDILDEGMDIATQALTVIEALTGNPIVATAEEIVSGVRAAVRAWRDGSAGTVDQAAVFKSLAKLATDALGNDAAADAALAAKFSAGD